MDLLGGSHDAEIDELGSWTRWRVLDDDVRWFDIQVKKAPGMEEREGLDQLLADIQEVLGPMLAAPVINVLPFYGLIGEEPVLGT